MAKKKSDTDAETPATPLRVALPAAPHGFGILAERASRKWGVPVAVFLVVGYIATRYGDETKARFNIFDNPAEPRLASTNGYRMFARQWDSFEAFAQSLRGYDFSEGWETKLGAEMEIDPALFLSATIIETPDTEPLEGE